MKVRIKKTGQILNVEYDDDDLYKGWDGGAVWFYANEFDIIEEETDTKPLFTLTAEEVDNLQSLFKAIKIADKNDLIHLGIVFDTFMDILLKRIKKWQDENNRTD